MRPGLQKGYGQYTVVMVASGLRLTHKAQGNAGVECCGEQERHVVLQMRTRVGDLVAT
jgi:hypothetical protein